MLLPNLNFISPYFIDFSEHVKFLSPYGTITSKFFSIAVIILYS